MAADPQSTSIRHALVETYYGKDVKRTSDLVTCACLTGGDSVTAEVQRALEQVHPEILNRYYGCGSPLPPLLKGCTVLDLGCGTGRDVYVAAQLVGPEGKVIGVDMTEEQLAIARQFEDWHREKFGYPVRNTAFVNAHIENLAEAGIPDASVDVVISNCVINLALDKAKVLAEVWRVLKPGGELYFSDVFADRRVPATAALDKVLVGECLAGALYKGDFRRIMRDVGFSRFYMVATRELDINNPDIIAKLDNARFFSETIRAFKVDGLEDEDEDYGHSVVYTGRIPGFEHAWQLGMGRTFITDVATRVDSNAALVLERSRYSQYVRITHPAHSAHRGAFVQDEALSLSTAPAAISASPASIPTNRGSKDAAGTGTCCQGTCAQPRQFKEWTSL